MTTEELNLIVSTVIDNLKSSGVEINDTQEMKPQSVSFLLGLKDNEMTRVSNDFINRIQGVSVSSDSQKDAFSVLGYESFLDKNKGYESYGAFNAALDELLYDANIVGCNVGHFRTIVSWREVEINNILLSISAQNIVQVVKGAIKIENDAITNDDSGIYRIIYRQHKNNTWGQWKEYGAIEDLEAIRAGAALGATALQSYTEQYKGTVTGIKINGATKKPSSGVIDLGTVITAPQDLSGYQPKLVSGTNIKTVNGVSILGKGNVPISETDPVFSASPASSITEENIKQWNAKANTVEILQKSVEGIEDDITLIYESLNSKYEQKILPITPMANGSLFISPLKYGVKTVVTEEINTLEYLFLQDPSGLEWAEYSLSFKVSMSVNAFNFPSNFMWENGVAPKVEANTYYELNVIATKIAEVYVYKATLKPFK